MRKIIVRTTLLALCGLFLVGVPAAQEREAGAPQATGLIPLDAREIELIVSTWPRITRVGLNPLGFERVNQVRARKGKPALDPQLVAPVGSETRSFVDVPGATVLAAAPNDLLAGDLPVSVDNSLLRYFPPIRSQGSLGACVPFATTYTQLSYMTAFQRNLDIRSGSDNTNKYSPKWTYNMVNGGSDNGSSFTSSYFLLEKHGAATWAEFPYDSSYLGWCLDPGAWKNALGVRTKAIQYVYDVDTDIGLDLVKELLTDGYVVVFGTYITSWVFGTVQDDASTSDDDAAVGKAIAYWLNGTQGGHAMTIVGYNDAIWTDINANGVVDPGEKGAFRIANSWGTGWREAGFTWLAYDALKNPSAVAGGPSNGRVAAFQSDMVFVLTARNGYSPLMIGEFTISHAKRNQIRLSLGRSNTTVTTPSTTWTPEALTGDGGAYAFDGSSTAVAATFALDLTDILAAGAGPQRYYLGLYDTTSGDAATLSAFKIIDRSTDPDTEAASSNVPQTIDARQGYAYVDYTYLGTAFNDPPQLLSPQVSPVSGGVADTYTFSVRYVDPDGDAPAVKDVIIDGVPHAMTLFSGQAASGWYSYATQLPSGEYGFYCAFEDGRGESARAPLAGDMNAPSVFGHRITSLAPANAAAGGADLVLVVNGAFFESGAVVTWDGSDRPTTFVSSSRLDAQIGAADLAVGRTVAVVVRNPGSLLSNSVQFPINNPSPALTSMSPTEANAGGSGVTLTCHGTNFVSNTIVRWNGIDLPTTYVSPAEVRGTVTAQNLSTAGSFEAVIFNPAPGGGLSQVIAFPVADFTLAAASPDLSVDAGGSASSAVEVAPRYGSFTAAVAFSCLGMPRGCTATFAPATVTPGASPATTTLTLRTTARTSALGLAAVGPAGLIPPAVGLVLLLAAFGAWALARRTPVRAPACRRLAAAALVLLAIGLAGCGAGGTNEPQDQGTPAGTYTIQVRGISGGLTVITPISLVVR